MYIMCVILRLFSAFSRKVGTLQISFIIIQRTVNRLFSNGWYVSTKKCSVQPDILCFVNQNWSFTCRNSSADFLGKTGQHDLRKQRHYSRQTARIFTDANVSLLDYWIWWMRDGQQMVLHWALSIVPLSYVVTGFRSDCHVILSTGGDYLQLIPAFKSISAFCPTCLIAADISRCTCSVIYREVFLHNPRVFPSVFVFLDLWTNQSHQVKGL